MTDSALKIGFMLLFFLKYALAIQMSSIGTVTLYMYEKVAYVFGIRVLAYRTE